MADLGFALMERIGKALSELVPLPGGWHVMRLKTPNFPVGYVDLTQSQPVRGQEYYAEKQTGVISIWTRNSDEQPFSPKRAFELSEQAHRLLGSTALSDSQVAVLQLQCGELNTLNPNGIDYGRAFKFTALTHEVRNG